MTTEALEALDELESRAREAYVSGPGKTVSDLVATLRAALTPPADDEISAIRARHEAARDEPETWTESHAWAHLDRATLLRHVDRLSAELAKERERRVEVEPWSTCISGAIWAEIRSGLTGRFEEQFTLHQRADRYEMSSAHLDECARILTHRIEGKLWPATLTKDTQ